MNSLSPICPICQSPTNHGLPSPPPHHGSSSMEIAIFQPSGRLAVFIQMGEPLKACHVCGSRLFPALPELAAQDLARRKDKP